VVTLAQALLVVVPLKSHLDVEATVSNRDTGFVSPWAGRGDQGDTFNFTWHGLLRGRV
jgi:hypothetical protein